MNCCELCGKELDSELTYCGACAAAIIKIGIVQQSLEAKEEEAKAAHESLKEELKDGEL